MTAKNDSLVVATATATLTHSKDKHKGSFNIVDKFPNNRYKVYGKMHGEHKATQCIPLPGAGCTPVVVSYPDGDVDTAFKDKSFSETVTISVDKSNGRYGRPGVGTLLTRARVCEATVWYWHACSSWKSFSG